MECSTGEGRGGEGREGEEKENKMGVGWMGEEGSSLTVRCAGRPVPAFLFLRSSDCRSTCITPIAIAQ